MNVFSKAIVRTCLVTSLLVGAFTGCPSTADKLRACAWPLSEAEVAEGDRDKKPGKSVLAEKFAMRVVEEGARVIYGEDTRRDYFELSAEERRIAAATAIVTYIKPSDSTDSYVKQSGDGFDLVLQPHTRGNFKACDDEKFGKQSTGGWCTSFLVGPDIVATAGHCIDVTTLDNMAFVFGFYQNSKDPDDVPNQFRPEQVYYARSLVAYQHHGEVDYAFVRLKRPVSKDVADPLQIRMHELQPGDSINVIGYPSGLPLKFGFDPKAEVKEVTPDKYFANLDTYGGNSGSPVLDQNGLVVGILVTGTTDYKIERPGCFRSVSISDETGAGGHNLTRTWEGVSKLSQFSGILPAGVNIED